MNMAVNDRWHVKLPELDNLQEFIDSVIHWAPVNSVDDRYEAPYAQPLYSVAGTVHNPGRIIEATSHPFLLWDSLSCTVLLTDCCVEYSINTST